MKFFFIYIIKAYRFFTKYAQPRCRFIPSCSSYAAEAIEKHGVFKGLYLSSARILKCNPLFPGGYDPVK
ncbi:MAG: membrane protein insertion efficiency factor YidD [Armatimonadota bacterium]